MTIQSFGLLFLFLYLYFATICDCYGGTVCLGLCHCIRDTVDCSSLDLAQIPSTIPNNTRVLILSDNEIGLVDETRLEQFQFLHTLDLSNNQIRSISPDFFENVPSLRVVNLRKNRLSRLPKGFHDRMDRLDLRSNLIDKISHDEFSQLANIRHVDLSRNLISSLPKIAAFGKSRIEKLDLASNSIIDISSDTFLSFQSLVSLKLSRNRITFLSHYAFSRLLQLQSIDLTRNVIREIKYFAFNQLPALRNVTISKNDIYRLDDGIFYACENIKRLNLANNRIQSVTIGWLFGLTNLEHLDLSFNQIQSFDTNSWSHTPNLKWLSLHSNRIQSLPSRSFRSLRKLEELVLSANSIDSLHKFALVGMDNLHRLDLSSNTLAVCVEDGAVLYNTSMPFLRSLRFTNNQLRVIPSRAFERFPALEELDITGNPIATIHPDAFQPLVLKSLIMNSSSILCDCQIGWLAQWIVKLKLDRSKIIAKCSYPSVLQNLDVMAIDRSNLTCLNDSPRPKIVAQPESQSAIVGQQARFTCNAYGEGPLEIEWRVVENGQARVLVQDSVTFMTINKTAIINGTMEMRELSAAELILDNIALTDQLDYQCVTRNRFGSDFSSHFELRVHEPPVFTSTPIDMILLTGQSAKFECSAVGTPIATVRWAFDRGPFPAAESRRLYVIPNDDHIYIMNVSMADEGVYSCHASNPAGSIQASARLTVYENEFRTILPPKIVAIREKTIELDCFSNLRNETQRMIWRKNEEVIEEENEQVLYIENAQFSDSGEYKCELWANETLLTMQITNVTVILESELSKVDSIRQKAFELKTFALKFAKNPENQSIIYTIALICLLTSLGICTSLSICLYTFWKHRKLQESTTQEVFL